MKGSDDDFNDSVKHLRILREMFCNIAIDNVNKSYGDTQISIDETDKIEEYFQRCENEKEKWDKKWKHIVKNEYDPRVAKWFGVK